MEVKFNKIDNVNAELTIELEASDYQDKVKQQLKEIAKNHAEPGFRAGHVPAGIINKKYGKAVKLDVLNKMISDELYKYISDNKLRVLGNPVAKADEEFNLDSDNFKFEFNVGLAPEINTHVNKDMTIPYYTIKVTDEMINNQDEGLRRRMGEQVSGEQVDATALVKGVITELDKNGNPKEGGIVVENGIVSPQHFKSEEQQKLFADKKVGDTIVFNPAATCDANVTEMSSMLNIAKEDVENHKGDFSFEIKDIIVLRPAELNQEYYDKVFGPDKVHDEKEYREALKNMIAGQLAGDSNFRFTIDARNKIMEAVGNIELPDAVLKDFLMQKNPNLNKENIDEEYAKMLPELTWQLVRDDIAEQLQIKIDEADLLNTAKMVSANQFAQYGMTGLSDEVIERYAKDILKDQKARESMANQAVEMKLFNGIRASVTLDNKEVSIEEFNELFAPAAEK